MTGHLSASFSATLRVQPAGQPRLVRAARPGDRQRRRPARRDRHRPRRARREGPRRHGRGDRRGPPRADRRCRPRARRRRGRARLRPHLPAPSRRKDRDALRSRRSGRETTSRWPIRRASPGSRPRSPPTLARPGRSRRSRTRWRSSPTDPRCSASGDIGPEAALPVMEGKAALFKEFAGVDAWPICLATTDPDEIVAAVKAIAPGFGGINLEDISSPRCFEIERRLRERAVESPSSTTTSTGRRSSSSRPS